MLRDTLSKAFGTAERMLTVMRTKAVDFSGGASSPGSIFTSPPGGEDGTGYPSARVASALQQYGHFREWVYACIRLIGSRVAGQEICVARKVNRQPADGMMTKALRASLPLRMKALAPVLEPVESHAVLDLLHDPWELGVAWGMMFSLVANLELTGRALWYVTTENGRPAIFPIPSSWIRGVSKDRSRWEIKPINSADSWFIPGDQVVYTYYPHPADPWGALSPLAAIGGAVLTDEAITQAQWRTFTQGQMPGLIFKAGRVPPPAGSGIPADSMPRYEFTEQQRQQLVGSIRRAFSGAQNFHEPLIVDRTIDEVMKLTFTPAELDFLNSSKVTKSKVLQGFGVSPILLGEVEGANRASATVADEIFCANKVNPLLELISQTLTEWLGPMFAGPGEKLVIWIEEARAKDSEIEIKWYELAAKCGAVTKNDVRLRAGLPAIDGGDELVERVPAGGAIDPAAAAAVKAIAKSLNPYSPPATTNGRPHQSVAAPARIGRN